MMYKKFLINLSLSLSLATAHHSRSASSPNENDLDTRSCSGAFKNVVFNSAVNSEPDFPGRFRLLQSYGISKWVGFTLDNAGPNDPNLNAHQLKMVVTGANVQAGVDLVTGPNAPQYLQILNEPDGGFFGQPKYTPQQAASIVRPLLDAQTETLFLSPAPAYPESSWLPDFFSACQCESRFSVILAHIYNPDPNKAISAIQTVMGQFPGKTIWITELAPASSSSQGCTLDEAGMISWMNTVLGWVQQQPQIERVFWNCGEYGTLDPNNPAVCNPSLTNTDGSATALLENYGKFCAN